MPRLTLLLFVVAACAPPVGDTNAETGLVGVQVGRGTLAGKWAQYVETHTIVPVPVFGDKPGGGTSTRLITRTWDERTAQYSDTFIRCTNEVFPVMDQRTVISPETLQKIRPATYRSTADSGGRWQAVDAVDVWGVKDLPDALETPLPTKDNFTMEPQSDWLFDEDDDGRPGVTVFAKGLVEARLSVCKRTVWTLDGTIVGEGRIQGLVRLSKGESNVVDATISWLRTEGSVKPDPDALSSWFDMVKLAPEATCDDVQAALDAGKLVTTRPF
jgi:hypothetical protein